MKTEVRLGIKNRKELCRRGVEIQRVGKHERYQTVCTLWHRPGFISGEHYTACGLGCDDI